jgi:hypothetical protein
MNNLDNLLEVEQTYLKPKLDEDNQEKSQLRYKFGPIDYYPITRVDFEKNALVISQDCPPDVSHQKREWTITDWFNYFAFGHSASKTTEVYHHKPPVQRHQIEMANSFRIFEDKSHISNNGNKTPKSRFFVHYDML